MYSNYLKIAWRNLRKNRGYTSINIGGLAIGMTSFLLIAVFIQNELSYDSYHEKANRIYRVVHFGSKDNKNGGWVYGNGPVGSALKSDFSEIVEMVQFSGRCDVLLNYQEHLFQESNCFYVDASVFSVFSWPLISGNPESALKAPYSIVLTESMAQKYFGSEDPMGKVIKGVGGRANDGTYTVTGVMKDVPSNSHFTFDVLMSMSSYYQTRPDIFEDWGYVDFYTYFLVADNFDLQAFQAKVPEFVKKNVHADDDGFYYDLSFEALPDFYLHSEAARQPGITGSLANIYIFAIIGLFILIIACINFMNLATARSLERAKEVGVRKVIGADKKSLIYQFLSESMTMVFLAAILGLVLSVFGLSWMREVTGKPFLIKDIFNNFTLALYIFSALITGLLAGSYPAFMLSSFKPSSVLKGIFKTSPTGSNLRKGLVVFQFSLSVALIACTVLVYFQMGYMFNKNLGFDREQQLFIDFNSDTQVLNNIEIIKNEFLNLPDVISAAVSYTVPGGIPPAGRTIIETHEGAMDIFDPFVYEVDYDFIPQYNVELIAGRNYSREFSSDTISSMVINQAAAKSFGYANPSEIIGKSFEQWGRKGKIIGVVKDFNYLSLHEKVAPLTLRYSTYGKYITLKIKSLNLSATISDIEKKWSELAPHRPFLYSFLDKSFNSQYEADFKFKNIFTIFSFLAILIACLGLLGLATYGAIQRTKEIGVRKVLGAHTSSIVVLLSKDFIKLVWIAILIATPFSWFVMNKWLDDYAYHVNISWWIFALAGGIATAIALITVSFHALKAANGNPVNSLRTE